MTDNKKSRKKKRITSKGIINEILNMDRLLYLKIIQEKGSLRSLQMTREVLALKKNLRPEQIEDEEVAKHNPNINARLKDLANLGILNDHEGEYSLCSTGFLIIDELPRLLSNIKILKKYKWFFDAHDFTVIPPQQFREIYKLQFAEQCKDAMEYIRVIVENTANANDEICIATERLHHIPSWIVEELRRGNLSLKLVYQFKEPFKINSDDEVEQELWENLTEEIPAKVELRYLTLHGRNPVGVRIIDKKWTILNLFELNEDKLNRSASFYGTHEQFIAWVRAIFSSIWNESKPLDVKKISETESMDKNP